MTIKLSPSKLNRLNDCPRCFFLEYKLGLKQASGIFPSLPGGMDNVIKKHYDTFRGTGSLPPGLVGTEVEGELLPDQAKMTMWRNWRTTDLIVVDEDRDAQLTGALDECIVIDKIYIPADYKTRGWPLKDPGDPAKYYQTQLDCYELMLESVGYKTAGYAWLIYYWPIEIDSDGIVKFEVTPIKLETEPERAMEIFRKAADILAQDDIPEANPECKYCKMERERAEI